MFGVWLWREDSGIKYLNILTFEHINMLWNEG